MLNHLENKFLGECKNCTGKEGACAITGGPAYNEAQVVCSQCPNMA